LQPIASGVDLIRTGARFLDFTPGELTASREIRAGSVLNPLAPGLLREFRCPAL
jgi:hypothetical protein